MRSWAVILSGFLVWAVHFFLLYGIGEFGSDSPVARVAIAVLTGLGLAACALLAWLIARVPRQDRFGRWRTQLARAGLGLGAIGILWQGLPALFAQ